MTAKDIEQANKIAYKKVAAAVLERAILDEEWDFFSPTSKMLSCYCGILELDEKAVIEAIDIERAKSAKQSSKRTKQKRIYYQFQGKTMSLNQIAKAVGIKRDTLYNRLFTGMTLEEATNPKKEQRKIEWQGGSYTIRELSNMTGVKTNIIYQRLKYGWPIERVLSEEVH